MISIIAVLVAGIVAYKQADFSKQQNKISLFELRYKIFSCVLECNNFARQICKLANEDEDLLEIYRIMHSSRNIAFETEQLNRHSLISDMISLVGELEKTDFLFPHDVSEYALKLSSKLMATITGCLVFKQSYVEEGKTDLEKVLLEYETDKIYDKMTAELILVTKPIWYEKLMKRCKGK